MFFFPHRQTGVMDFREENHRGQVPFYPIISRMCTINLINSINMNADVDPDHLARVVFVRFSPCLFSPLSILSS